MQIKTIDRDEQEIDYERLFKAYEGLIKWINTNDVDGQETLGLLIKAAVSLAVVNERPKREVLEVVSVTYDIERSVRPRADEVH
jgi:hypothetical protein